MREYKFRGKDKERDWIYGSLYRDNLQNCWYITDNETEIGIEVEENTIGQYTGLKDKNKKEIYEGDILKINVDRACVKWNDKYGYFQLVPIGDYYFDSDVIGQALEYVEAEVIGNIYDNPELLEERE